MDPLLWLHSRPFYYGCTIDPTFPSGYFGKDPSAFIKKYQKAIEVDNDRRVLGHLRRMTEPFFMRRRKADKAIEVELPSKTVQDIVVELPQR